MAGYAFNFTLMEDVMGRMKSSGDIVNDVIATIESAVKGLDLQHWDGAARDAYAACQTDWDNAATQMQGAYSDALKGLNDCHNNYAHCEGQAQKMWQTLQTY